MFTPSSCENIGIEKFKFAAKKKNFFRLFKAMRQDETIRKKAFLLIE